MVFAPLPSRLSKTVNDWAAKCSHMALDHDLQGNPLRAEKNYVEAA